jgi:hypothetical protein
MNPRQFSLRWYSITRAQSPRFNNLADFALNPLIGGDTVSAFNRHSVSLDLSLANCKTGAALQNPVRE